MIEFRLPPEMILERALPASAKSGLATVSFSEAHLRTGGASPAAAAVVSASLAGCAWESSKDGGRSGSSRGSMISGRRSMLGGASVDEAGSMFRVWLLLTACTGMGMTICGGTGMGACMPTTSPSKESPSTSEVGAATPKLTEEEEDGFGCDAERSALGGREVAGTGLRRMEVGGGVEASAEEEYETPGKLPGTLCLRRLGSDVAGGDVDAGAP